MNRYTEALSNNKVVFLKNGIAMSIDEILKTLNETSDFNLEKIMFLPCPFCGVTPKLIKQDGDTDSLCTFDIACSTDGCYLERGADWWLSVDDVREMWNKRIKNGNQI